MKFGLFEHGGRTRKMLTIEIGRASTRDTKLDTAAKVLQFVRGWLDRNGVKDQELRSSIRMKLKCYVCGEPLEDIVTLATMAEDVDRVFVMHDQCSKQCEEQVKTVLVKIIQNSLTRDRVDRLT